MARYKKNIGKAESSSSLWSGGGMEVDFENMEIVFRHLG